jgi:hypothetical protein
MRSNSAISQHSSVCSGRSIASLSSTNPSESWPAWPKAAVISGATNCNAGLALPNWSKPARSNRDPVRTSPRLMAGAP